MHAIDPGPAARRRRRGQGALIAALAFAALTSQAQTFPSRPIRLVVPFTAGGTTDGIARIVAETAGELLGQPVVVDNRPGAGGNIGTDQVAKSKPDGYTLAMVGNSFTVNPSLYRAMPYRQGDLTAVVMAGMVPFVLVANPNLPYRTTAEFIAYARAHPDKVTYASGGSGTIGHLGGHWLADLAKVRMQHIPYKGGSAAMTDLLGGQVDVFLDTLITSTPFLKAGKVRPLFVTTGKRLEDWPEVPTASEVGLPDLSFSAWVGIVAPAGTPADVIGIVNQKVNAALASPEVRRKLAALGASPMGGSAKDAQKFMADETARWGAVVRASGAQLDN